MTSMQSILIRLDLTREQCLRYYQGGSHWVMAQSIEGRRIQFPASVLHRIVGPQGVSGIFRIRFTDEGRFEDIQRVSS
ncbi:hypothetical protein BFW38_10610 [Terasakiispira papahanaumokuakeensis]|uniref:DUF2835 domain-containing protein n=2 Tax=Terasakiispira papahanaumokuakeensis TaxID=197479 RepID=A0A1E2VAN8_9GAMM|nr:hypothetical protein BFW38_10610 [Terasakiispira papahanaumokuakeensis]